MSLEIQQFNEMFKSLPPKATRKLKNFDGHKRYTFYRGVEGVNKISEYLNPNHPCTLIRRLSNEGTKSRPDLRDTMVSLRNNKEEVLVWYKNKGYYKDGLIVEVYKGDSFELPTIIKHFKDFETLRKDNYFVELFERITGRNVTGKKVSNKKNYW